jgi:hypothetical protein
LADNNSIEAPITFSMVASDDRDAPRLTLRATNLQQLQSMLQELENGSVSVDIGRVAATYQAQARVGAILEAKPLDPAVDGGSFDGVKAAATVTSTPPAATTPPPAPVKKAGGFPAFKAPVAAAKPPATPPPATAARPTAEPPAPALAKDGFPQAPQWKKP